MVSFQSVCLSSTAVSQFGACPVTVCEESRATLSSFHRDFGSSHLPSLRVLPVCRYDAGLGARVPRCRLCFQRRAMLLLQSASTMSRIRLWKLQADCSHVFAYRFRQYTVQLQRTATRRIRSSATTKASQRRICNQSFLAACTCICTRLEAS